MSQLSTTININSQMAREFIKYARHLVSNGTYKDGFDFYLMAFERHPVLMKAHEREFRDALLKLSSTLSTTDDIKTLFSNFYTALDMFPENAELCNDIGKYLYKYHFYMEAWLHFEKVLELNPFHVNAEKNLNSVKNLFVERWHFRMLNDHIRNEYYRHAIQRTVTANKDRVIDVGTGTGLLAIYAREAGASMVVACDGSEIMAEIAKRVIHYNNLKNIKVINKMSTALNMNKLNDKSTLLLTEMFDAGLFGEHVLQMLSHAWQAFLTPDARIIPNKAEFFVVGVQCDYLNKKYQLSSKAKELLNISYINVQVLSFDETYDCEDVHMIKNIKYITDPVSVVKVDFNDPKNIEQVLEKVRPYKVELKANENGVIDNVVGWFNLYLSDTVTITTNPLADNRANAWQQAVFSNGVPKHIKENETIHLDFFINGGKLRMSSDLDSVSVSPEVVRFLNDLDYLKKIDSCVEEACKHFEGVTEMSQITVVDLCPFPYFGFQMLKRGAQDVICNARNGNDEQFIIEVCNENNISLDNVTLIEGDHWTSDIFADAKYHIIFSHCLELCGDVDLRLIDISLRLKNAHLHENGLFMPHEIKLMGQLVSCHWLDINNKVYDENVSNYKIARSINKYQVTQNFFIDFSLLRFVPISDPVEVCQYPGSKRFDPVSVPVVNNGLANAILCWYKIELLEKMERVSTNRPNSFIDGMLFLTNSKESIEAGRLVTLAQYRDNDGAFRLLLLLESKNA